MQGQQSLKKSSFKQNENIWLKTKTSKKLNINFEEIEEFIILNWFKKKKSFQTSMERQLNHLIREQLHNINRSYPSKILSDKLADLIAKYLVCHAQDRRILHGITQAQIAYNYIIRILYVFIDLSLIHIWRCRRLLTCRSRWSPYH